MKFKLLKNKLGEDKERGITVNIPKRTWDRRYKFVVRRRIEGSEDLDYMYDIDESQELGIISIGHLESLIKNIENMTEPKTKNKIKEYIHKNGLKTTREIGDYLGMDARSVWHYMKRHNLPYIKGPKKKRSNKAEAERLIKEGLNLREIAGRMGISTERARQIIRNNDLPYKRNKRRFSS